MEEDLNDLKSIQPNKEDEEKKRYNEQVEHYAAAAVMQDNLEEVKKLTKRVTVNPDRKDLAKKLDAAKQAVAQDVANPLGDMG